MPLSPIGGSAASMSMSMSMVCIIMGACGGNSVDNPNATGGAAVGGSASESTGGAGAEGAPDCKPVDDTCPEGTYCQLRDGRTACVDEGSTLRDETCDETGTCQRGSICLSAGEFGGMLCQQACSLDEQEDRSICDNQRHTCFVALDDEEHELPFGVCRYSR